MIITTLEIIRLFVFPILGMLLMFVLQPTLYQSQIIRLTDVKMERWLPNGYYPQATLVFGCAIFAALAWCVWNTMSPPGNNSARKGRSIAWWILSLLPIIGVAAATIWSRKSFLGENFGSDVATLSLVALFSFDVLFLYWLTTATTTPGNARDLPPGASLFRR
jgi:cytochrome bd-type quinol oxidase subunit 2